MPTRWTLALRAEHAGEERPVTPIQLHGMAASLLEGAGADHGAQRKPYAVGPLMASGEDGTALLRLGWLQDGPRPDLSALVGHRVRLGAQFFTVTGADEEFTAYGALLRVPKVERVMVRFVSATYFSRSGRWYPLPDPGLLYGGLITRWNHFAAKRDGIDEVWGKALLSSVALSAHQVTSRPVALGAGSRIGFTGNAAFTIVGKPDREVSSLLGALTLFATASGVGAQTTHGLGHIEVELRHPDRPGGAPAFRPGWGYLPLAGENPVSRAAGQR